MNDTPPTLPSAKEIGRRAGIITGTVALALLVYWLLPADMNELARRMAGLFVVAAVFWATEVIPLYATSLCVVALQVLLLASGGGLAPEGDLTFSHFFDPFASGVIILFMGGFLLSAAVTKHELDRAIAAKVLRPFTFHPLALLYGIIAITAFFSMWMSNTATTAMMMALVMPLLRNSQTGEKFDRAMILAVPLGANVGGIGTPIGTPPNAIALGALRREGFQIGFLDWMAVAVPLELLLLALGGLLLYVLLPPTRGAALPQIERAGRISFLGKVTLTILGLTILAWITSRWHGVADAVVALISAAALTALRVLDRKDVDSIDWNILILMWGGLALGAGMEGTGLVDYVMELPIAAMSGFWLAVVVVLLSVGLSTFMSNTAAAGLIIPMALALSVAQRGQLVVLTALACSFAMVLPISTPPNAIAFASGKLPAKTLLRVGGLITALGIVALLAGYQVVLPLFLNLQVEP
ncbi:MAG: SLC13 family permease [Phycisphaeraceae bacterium]